MKQEIKVLIIDDHPAMALGIKHLLEQDLSIRVIGIATNGQDGIIMAQRLLPNVVVLDMNLPDDTGVHVAAEIKERHPEIHLVIHTAYDYAPYFNRLIESGVSGMLNKSAAPEDIVGLVHAVVRGYTILPLPLFRQIQLQRPDHIKHYWEADLTATERKILSMVANKETNRKIASVIPMSESSVENYLNRIYKKLGVKSKAEAIAKIANDDRFQPVEDV